MILDKDFPQDIRVENEAISLSKNGFDVYLLCFALKNESVFEHYKGFHIVRIPTSRYWTRKMRALVTVIPIYDLFLVEKIQRFVSQYNIDILHVHDLYLLGAALKVKKQLNIPIVSDLHENYVEGLKNYRFANSFPGNLLISIEKWSRMEIEWLNQVDRIIVVVEEAIDRLEALGIDRGKIHSVQNYVNCEEYDKYDIIDNIVDKYKNELVYSYIGAFDTHRGLMILLEGYAKAITQGLKAHLMLIGRGKIEKDLKKKAAELAVTQNVNFIGFRPYHELPSYVLASDVGIVPHMKTGHTDNTLPHKLFHYMYQQKPVIVSDCNPLKRIVNDCRCGRVYRHSDSDDLAASLIWAYDNRARLKTLGTHGRSAVIKKYNWKTAEKNLVTMYENF